MTLFQDICRIFGAKSDTSIFSHDKSDLHRISANVDRAQMSGRPLQLYYSTDVQVSAHLINY